MFTGRLRAPAVVFGTAICLAFVGLATPISHAQTASSDATVSTGAGPFAAATKLFVGTEGGYDSNLDNRLARTGSAYEMLQAGLTGDYKVSNTEAYSLYLRGRRYWYNDLDQPNRYDVDAAVGARYDFSKETSAKFGASWIRDAVSFNPLDIFKAYADVVYETTDVRLRLKADSRTEVSFGKDDAGTTPPDIFAVSSNKAFDYTKNGVTGSLLLARSQFLSPFAIANYTLVDYFNQEPNASIDRNANETWGVAGLRVNLSKDLYVDVGARYNYRDFEDHTFRQFSSSWFDARLNWRATDSLTLNLIVERVVKEPSTSFGLADDVKTYEARVDYKAGAYTIYAKAFLDQVRPIGDDFNFKRYNWSFGVVRELDARTDVYVDYAGKYVTDEVTDDSYTRHAIGAGIKFKF